MEICSLKFSESFLAELSLQEIIAIFEWMNFFFKVAKEE